MRNQCGRPAENNCPLFFADGAAKSKECGRKYPCGTDQRAAMVRHVRSEQPALGHDGRKFGFQTLVSGCGTGAYLVHLGTKLGGPEISVLSGRDGVMVFLPDADSAGVDALAGQIRDTQHVCG